MYQKSHEYLIGKLKLRLARLFGEFKNRIHPITRYMVFVCYFPSSGDTFPAPPFEQHSPLIHLKANHLVCAIRYFHFILDVQKHFFIVRHQVFLLKISASTKYHKKSQVEKQLKASHREKKIVVAHFYLLDVRVLVYFR